MTTVPSPSDASIQHSTVDVGEVKLHVVEQGAGPPVVLLHGFPEFWFSWRHQIPALAAAGFRAIAPDLRGYNLSDKPRGVKRYRIEPLCDDVAGLIRALVPGGRAHVVGHDWGGAVAWHFAIRHPDLVDRLVVMNSAHQGVLERAFKRPSQIRKSWYMAFFQLPWLPERMIRDPSFAYRAFRGTSANRAEFPDEVCERFAEAIRQPGAATAMINYYRAAARHRVRIEPVRAKTLIVWGEQDRFLGPELLDEFPRWLTDLRVVRVPDASHWVQQDRPEVVNRALIEFLASERGQAA